MVVKLHCANKMRRAQAQAADEARKRHPSSASGQTEFLEKQFSPPSIAGGGHERRVDVLL